MSPHSIFGWSYPPGCSGPPDDDPAISPQSEEIQLLLEDAEVDQGIIDKVIKIIDNLAYDASHCPVCEKASIKAEEDYYNRLRKAKPCSSNDASETKMNT